MKNPKRSLTIGNFDGVHRGHRALVEKVLAFKRNHNDQDLKTAVITFDPHPAEVLKPGIWIPRLSSLAERCHLFQNAGVDEVHVLPFTDELCRMKAKDFFEQILVKQFNAAFIAVGHDFNFGYKKEGTPGRILDWSQEAHIPATVVEAIEADGAPVSSSRIRHLLQEGHVIGASRLLGRDYTISGEVMHGDKRGRLLGFPTANLKPSQGNPGDPCLPKNGVYLTATTIESKTFASITNVGTKPTVNKNLDITVETHILDFEGDLYGKFITVEFRDRLRDEKRFGGLEELKQQIQEDTTKAKSILKIV